MLRWVCAATLVAVALLSSPTAALPFALTRKQQQPASGGGGLDGSQAERLWRDAMAAFMKKDFSYAATLFADDFGGRAIGWAAKPTCTGSVGKAEFIASVESFFKPLELTTIHEWLVVPSFDRVAVDISFVYFANGVPSVAQNLFQEIRVNAAGTQITGWLEIAPLSEQPDAGLMEKTWATMARSIYDRSLHEMMEYVAPDFTSQSWVAGQNASSPTLGRGAWSAGMAAQFKTQKSGFVATGVLHCACDYMFQRWTYAVSGPTSWASHGLSWMKFGNIASGSYNVTEWQSVSTIVFS
jgi:hypothetical protein